MQIPILKMEEETKNAATEPGDGERSVRNSWPEMVGLTGEEAKTKIAEENPRLSCHIVGPDHMVTADYRLDRVWIYVDSEGKVIRTPTIG